MSNQIFWILELAVDPDKYDDFASLKDEMIDDVAANEPGTLSYEWFISEDKSVCHLFERYQDSTAVMQHLNLFFTTYAERFFDAATTTRMMVYGEVPDEVRKILDKAGAQFVDRWQ